MSQEREGFHLSQTTIDVPGGMFRRARQVVIHEAVVDLQPGEHRYRLSDLLNANFLPEIGERRVVTIIGDQAGCAIDSDGDLVEVDARTGVVTKTMAFVTDRDSIILQNVVPVTLNVETAVPPSPYEGVMSSSPATFPPTIIPSSIPLGKITHITIASFPE